MMPVTSQPYATSAPLVAVVEHSNEKACSHSQEHQQLGHAHESGRCQCNRARRSRSRRILAAVLLAAFSMMMFALVSCIWDAAFNDGSWLSSFGFAEGSSGGAWSAIGGFVKRQSDGTVSDGNTFVDRKCRLPSSSSFR